MSTQTDCCVGNCNDAAQTTRNPHHDETNASIAIEPSSSSRQHQQLVAARRQQNYRRHHRPQSRNSQRTPQTAALLIIVRRKNAQFDHRSIAQMEQKLNQLARETNLLALNQRTRELAQSIATALANMICPTRTTTPMTTLQKTTAHDDETNDEKHRNQTDNPNNNAPTTLANANANSLDWPDSFIRLLDALAAKQLQLQQQQLKLETLPESNLDRPHSASSISSLAIDERDFELLTLKFGADRDDHDDSALWLATDTRASPASSTLNLSEPQQTQIAKIANETGCNSLLQLDYDKSNNNDDSNNNNNNNQNYSDGTKTDQHPESNVTLVVVGEKSNDSDSKLGLQNATNLPQMEPTKRSNQLLQFDQITLIELSPNNDQHDNNTTTTSQRDFESMIIVQDFDDDDECDADLEAPAESALEGSQQEQSNPAADSIGHQRQSVTSDGPQSLANQDGSIRSRHSLQKSTTLNNNNPQQQQQQDDGKHSLLQFALYNFREAVDKYSLESQQEAGDTSTLRGSLKLLESLRSGMGGSRGSTANKAGRASRSNRRNSGSSAAGGANTASGAPSLQGDWTWRELAEMVKWTKTPIKQSLLKLPSDELSRRAADCFLAVMQYMGDWQAPASVPAASGKQKVQQQQVVAAAEPAAEVECVYLILSHCHNWPELRDELYCQLMKQTTSNRSERTDSCLRGWRLFSILAAYFDCSEPFKPYLLNYLETAAYDKRRAYYSVASLCLQNLRKTLRYGGRKNVPSIEEIAATSAGRNSKRQIYRLPGGTERVINTKSTTVVDDIIREICINMLGVSEADEMLEFSLYCIADGDLYTMPLSRDEYILDVTTELVKNHQQYFLIFCRSIWHHPLRLDSRLYIEVIFNQVAPDYLEGLLMVLPGLRASNSGLTSAGGSVSSNGGGRLGPIDQRQYHHPQQQQQQPLRLRTKLVKEVARIAALLHRASGTDYMPHKDEIRYLLPRPLVAAMKLGSRSAAGGGGNSSTGNDSANTSSLERNNNISPSELETVITSPQKWVELVQDNWREMSAFDTLDAKAQFLEIVRHWPLFGSSFFAIKLIQRDLIQPADYILALNKLGIQMLEPASHETIHLYPLNEVVSTRKVRSEDGALFLDLKCGNLMKRTIIRIQTDQAHEISRLIRQYIDIELLQQRQRQQATPVGSKTTLISTIQPVNTIAATIKKSSMAAVTTPGAN